MKSIVITLILFTSFSSLGVLSTEKDSISPIISKSAISINALGFLQFGPIIAYEHAISDFNVLNAHIRLPGLGMATYWVNSSNDGLDYVSGTAFGTGIVHFFGERKNKPYAGIHFEYESLSLLYADGEQWEWSQQNSSLIFISNAGYRMRYPGGFFFNAGLFLGMTQTNYSWDYKDKFYGTIDSSDREGKEKSPFGMVELTVGVGF